MGESFTLRGVTRTGIIDSISTSVAFSMGMAIPSEPIMVTFKLPSPALSPVMALGERITARGKAYVVRSIDEDEISFTVHCEKVEAH